MTAPCQTLRTLCIAWSWVIITLFCSAASAQDRSPPVGARSSVVPTPTAIAAGRKAVNDDAELSQEAKTKALEYYDRAAQALEKSQEAATKTAALIARIEQGPARIAELRARLANPDASVDIALPPADTSAEQLAAAVNQKRAASTVARDALNDKEAALAALTQSGTAIVEEYVARERSLAKIKEEALVPASVDMPPALSRARKIYLGARQLFEQAELSRLQRRNTSYDLLVELSSLERDVAAAEMARIQHERTVLEEALQERRETDARSGRWEAEAVVAASAALPAPVAAIAEETAALKKELLTVIENEKEVNDALRAASVRYGEIKSRFQAMRERLSIYGASQALGRMLQKRLEKLPSPREQRKFARVRRNETARVTDRRIEVEDQQQQLSKSETEVDSILASIQPPVSTDAMEALRDQTTTLVKEQRDTLAEVDIAYGRYLTRITALEAADREIADTAQEFSEFIRQELTWIPNLSPLTPSDFAGLPKALGWLLAPANWRQAMSDAGRTFASNPLYSGAALVLIVLCVIGRWQARHRLPELAELTLRIRTDAYSHTTKALGLTIVAASVWPLIFAVAGWQVEADPIGEPFGNDIGSALINIVPFVSVLSLLHWLTRTDGLCYRHFRWPEEISTVLHKRIRWLAALMIPAAFLANAASRSNINEMFYAIGRPMLLLILVTLTVFLWRSFRRSDAFMRHFDAHRPDGFMSRLWILWFPLLLIAPIVLFLGAAFGYLHTAAELTALLIGQTAMLLISLLLIKDMLLRWFYIIERRSRFEIVVRQREQARADRESHEEDTAGSAFDADIPEVDYRGLGEQARSVIRVGVLLGLVLGVGWIWGDLLPAIGLLDQIQLPFSKVVIVDGVEQQLPVTLANLAVGILILAGTLFAAKNLSGLLGYTVLRRLRLDAGGNYAIVTLCQYLIVAVGFLVAFSTIGLQWSKLQWLIAALGVGLGFGLQEIVANFVSGIILLLERPVRIGDIVTVGNADGHISRIRIRATTIITWEKKELIIPNKEFITGQVVNWTLSDSVNRILINVGIAYGSNVRKALDLLELAVKENPRVLAEPAPIVTFEAFGDNALMLYARCYISSLDHRLETITELHESIYAKFEHAGIVIAFPQRDVHLDTSKPLEIRVHQGEEQPAGNSRSDSGPLASSD
jgi:potassium-dependent mechanosensitive channel